jgi:hypothetical protein
MPESPDTVVHALIARLRELENADDVCKYTGEADLDVAYARAFGRARDLAGLLADYLEQPGS